MKNPLAARLRATVLFSTALAGFATANQILEVYADSLTTYQAGLSGVQGVMPRVEQRGVNLDGSPRAGSTFQMAIAGNPFENVWTGHAAMHNGIRLDTGTWAPTEVDIALPAPGHRWVIGRTYNARQDNSGQMDSDGYQGRNWFQTSQPEIVLYDDADNSKDVVYLVFGADRYAEFQRVNSTSNQFKGKNGAAGVFDYQSGSPDLYVYTDQVGMEFTFLGFNTSGNAADGQLWKIEDAASNVAYVGDSSSASTAVSSGYDSGGRITYAYDSADRRYTYTYTTLDSVDRLTQVKVETKSGGTWASPTGLAEVSKVDYTYYTSETYGDIGDLKTVELTTPLSDPGINDERVKYYRYWEGTYNSSTNPGHPHAIRLVLDYEGARNFDWSESGAGEPEFDDGFLTANTDDLKPYAAAYFEYDSTHRIDEAWFNGSCGCSGAGTGTHSYRYEASGYTNDAGYDKEWARRTSVQRPDDSWITQYFDETGQPLSYVVTDDDPANTSPVPNMWVHYITRNAYGAVKKYSTPANVNAYTHSTGAIGDDSGNNLCWKYLRVGQPDSLAGFLIAETRSKSTAATAEFVRSNTWTSFSLVVGDATVIRPLPSQFRAYEQTGIIIPAYSGFESITYAAYTGAPLVTEEALLDHPVVGTSNNGSGSANETDSYYDQASQLTFQMGPDGVITYREYSGGYLIKVIEDANTSSLSPPSGYSSSGSPLHEITTYSYDPQGRPKETGLPTGRITKSYYTRLADRRLVQLDYPKYVSGPNTFYGPFTYTVRNHAGKVEASGTIALSSGATTTATTGHIDETDADPITAVDTGTVAQFQTSLYDASGTMLEEQRAYFSIPSSGAGTDGTHYDPTLFAYDDMGHRWRTKEANGTIRRTVFDLHGRATEQWIGTNDSSFSGGEASGTDDMVKTDAIEFDSGNDSGNGYVTKRTAYVQDSTTNQRVTTFGTTWRGWMTLQVNPVPPHFVHDYDNQGRRTATAGYSSSTNISKATDPDTFDTDRVTYGTTHYDEQGRVWKEVRYKVDQADGSDDDSLEILTWYDPDGRVVKRDGEQLQKWGFDRLGRQTHEFMLAKDNDTAYADADDVSGDIVLVERQTTLEDGGRVIMVGVIERLHDDYGTGETTGALDTNADADAELYTAANLEGRIQITAMWYDSLDRLVDTVRYGTYGGSNFDRDGLSVPTRSDTALRTTNTYNDDGTLKEVEDPKGLKTRYEYDDLGRQTKVIANYDDGTPGGTDGDEDQTMVYGYTDGLRTAITADLPSGETDQVTTYTYGTTKGVSAGDSKVSTGHLLQEVEYPDSASASDVVTFAYNAQGQQVYKQDQAGNVIETDYDDGGREEHRRVTTLASGFDGAVKRIMTAYDDRGMRATVTQYDNATAGSGSVVDEVAFSYDDWGNLSTFEQDRNSSVGASGSVDDYEISYTYKKKITGRNTVRRDSMTLPSGNVIDFQYSNVNGLYDNASSRVSQVKDGANRLATYEYNGISRVVSTSYDQADVASRLTGGSSYEGLDLFNRWVNIKWTKEGLTGGDVDFYDIDLSYDRNSNVSSMDDLVHDGFDVRYYLDDLDRVTRVEEGTLAGGFITSRTRDQQWDLTQIGNWNQDKLDLNGDGDFTDTGEYTDDREHNLANELTGQFSASVNLDYDETGNLTDDGIDYEYIWDAFYRLREVRDRSDSSLVAECRYNGLGYLIGYHGDTEPDGDVDSNDEWYYFAYDERWRSVGTFREHDSSPKEEFVFHNSGLDGLGGASYIDAAILRDKDADTRWGQASDGVLEERIYYCDSRGDVVVLVDSGGAYVAGVRYSAYGVPFGLPVGDVNSDGSRDSTDAAIVAGWNPASYPSPPYDVRGDLDLDGDIDFYDESAVVGLSTASLGRGALAEDGVGNRRGFNGYHKMLTLDIENVRPRWRSWELGRWFSRDLIGGVNLYAYVGDNPIKFTDWDGLQAFEKGGMQIVVDSFVPEFVRPSFWERHTRPARA